MTIMLFDEWVEKYKPIENPFTGDIEFETYGQDVEFLNSCEPSHIWTKIDNDYGVSCIINGAHYVNRINYYVTEIPFQDEDGWLEVYDEQEDLEELERRVKEEQGK